MTTPLSDERLAEMRIRLSQTEPLYYCQLTGSEVHSLLAEVERLRTENGRLLTELLDADRYVGAAETDMEMLRARVACLESVLRSVEWGADIRVGDGDYDNGCLVCFRLQREGHAPNCALDAALRDASE